MKRTTKAERRFTRRTWPRLCQRHGTALIARIARDQACHLILRISDALEVPPMWLLPTPADPGRGAKEPMPPVLVEMWSASDQVRWMRPDTGAFHIEAMSVAIEPPMRAYADEMLSVLAGPQIWTEGSYEAS